MGAVAEIVSKTTSSSITNTRWRIWEADVEKSFTNLPHAFWRILPRKIGIGLAHAIVGYVWSQQYSPATEGGRLRTKGAKPLAETEPVRMSELARMFDVSEEGVRKVFLFLCEIELFRGRKVGRGIAIAVAHPSTWHKLPNYDTRRKDVDSAADAHIADDDAEAGSETKPAAPVVIAPIRFAPRGQRPEPIKAKIRANEVVYEGELPVEFETGLRVADGRLTISFFSADTFKNPTAVGFSDGRSPRAAVSEVNGKNPTVVGFSNGASLQNQLVTVSELRVLLEKYWRDRFKGRGLTELFVQRVWVKLGDRPLLQYESRCATRVRELGAKLEPKHFLCFADDCHDKHEVAAWDAVASESRAIDERIQADAGKERAIAIRRAQAMLDDPTLDPDDRRLVLEQLAALEGR